MSEDFANYLVLPCSPPRTPSHSFVSQDSNENVQIINNGVAELFDYFLIKVIEMYKVISFVTIRVRKLKNSVAEFWQKVNYTFYERKSAFKESLDQHSKKVLRVIKNILEWSKGKF